MGFQFRVLQYKEMTLQKKKKKGEFQQLQNDYAKDGKMKAWSTRVFIFASLKKWWQGCKLFHPVFNGEDEITPLIYLF